MPGNSAATGRPQADPGRKTSGIEKQPRIVANRLSVPDYRDHLVVVLGKALVRKASRRRTADDLPVHSLHTLLDDLATVVRNRAVPRIRGAKPFRITTRPTPLQQRAFDLLGIRPERVR